MKTFKSFLAEQQQQKLPAMMAVFGSHSRKKLPGAQAVFGSHSQVKPKPISKFHANPIISSPIQKEAAEAPTEGLDQIKNHFGPAEDKIHNEHKVKDKNKGLRDYTYDSTDINRSLFRHHQTGEHPKTYSDFRGELGYKYNKYNSHEHIKRVDKVLNKHKITKDTHVFSGLSRPPMDHFKGKTNKPAKVHFPAYTSTTTNFNQSLNFTENGARKAVDHTPLNQDAPKSKTGNTRHVLKIHVPKGTPGGSVRHLTHYDNENEILLHRGMNMEIHHQPTVIDHPYHGHVTVWHARIIEHKPAKL